MEAETKSQTAMKTRLRPVESLLSNARDNTKKFAASVVSWKSKWAFVRIAVDPESHQKYLAEQFAQHLFSPQKLQAALEAACRSYADDLDGVEAEMLVQLRADLADPKEWGRMSVRHLDNHEAFVREYRALADKLVREVAKDVAVQAGREVVSWVAADVATQVAMQALKVVAVEMGIQGGVLSAGAASTAVTLGVGFVISIIIDAILDAVFKGMGYDPEAKIEQTVRESLIKMEAALLYEPDFYDSDEKTGSLRAALQKLHEGRSNLRRKTVETFLSGGAK